MKQSPKIVFFGNERLATGVTTTAPVLRALISDNYEVCAVVVNNDAAVSRRQRALEVAEVAAVHGIPVLAPAKPADVIEQLQNFEADAGILVAYGKIVPQSIIEIFPAGIINIHPSLLPLHRGPTPLESVILNGETETGVSLMALAREMDAGPVYAQRTYSVPSKITKQQLTDSLLQIGSEMVIKNVPAILKGSLVGTPQDNSAATYDSLIDKSAAAVDWSKPALQLEREVRAYASWPKSIASIGSHEVILIDVDVTDTTGDPGTVLKNKHELIINCGQGSLKINRLQPVGKKEMPVQAFLNGYVL